MDIADLANNVLLWAFLVVPIIGIINHEMEENKNGKDSDHNR